MKTKLPETITTIAEARRFLKELFDNGESFHPEDSAFHIRWADENDMPTAEECHKLNDLMAQMSKGIQGFDPCEYLLLLLQPMKFSKLHFNDMNTEQYDEVIGNFAKQTGLSLEQSECELEALNPFVIKSEEANVLIGINPNPEALPDMPNGFRSWFETVSECFYFITRCSYTTAEHNKFVIDCRKHNGYTVYYDLALLWAEEFEELNNGRTWNGEFFDEIEKFCKAKAIKL